MGKKDKSNIVDLNLKKDLNNHVKSLMNSAESGAGEMNMDQYWNNPQKEIDVATIKIGDKFENYKGQYSQKNMPWVQSAALSKF